MTNTEWLKALQKHARELSFFADDKDYRKWLKDEYRKHGTYAAQRDRLAHGLSDGRMWQRTAFDSDGEGWRDYGFVSMFDIAYDLGICDRYGCTDRDLTDEDMAEWFSENMVTTVSSGHDCTGRAFTQWVHWHVNPNGMVSFVHRMALDVWGERWRTTTGEERTSRGRCRMT